MIERISSLLGDLKANLRLLPQVIGNFPLLLLWLGSARRAQTAAAIAIVALLTIVPAGIKGLTDFAYQPVVKEQKLLGLLKTSKTVENPLRTKRYRQLMVLAWLLGLSPAGVLLIAQLPLALRQAREKGERLLAQSRVLAATDAQQSETLRIRAEHFLAAFMPEDTDAHATALHPVATASHEFADIRVGPNQRYHIRGLVARGGMGEVYLGDDEVLHRQVAAKALAANLYQDEEQRTRFNQEALALARLSHPNIVSVLDLFEDAGRFWFIMELLPGGDLDERLKDGPLPEREALQIIRSVAEGLAYAHTKGIVHRDIKPTNILFSENNTPKLTDFGIAKLPSSAVVTQIGMALGSPGYMSPEQAAGDPVDERSDLYSLGVTLFRMLTGGLPFQGDTSAMMSQHITAAPPAPKSLNENISDKTNALILTCLAKKPADRYPSARALIEAIDQSL